MPGNREHNRLSYPDPGMWRRQEPGRRVCPERKLGCSADIRSQPSRLPNLCQWTYIEPEFGGQAKLLDGCDACQPQPSRGPEFQALQAYDRFRSSSHGSRRCWFRIRIANGGVKQCLYLFNGLVPTQGFGGGTRRAGDVRESVRLRGQPRSR